MADDTPLAISGPENAAIIALWCRIAEVTGTPVNTLVPAIREELDALIAAVRAEQTAEVEPTRCRHCGRACQVDECLDCWRQRQVAR